MDKLHYTIRIESGKAKVLKMKFPKEQSLKRFLSPATTNKIPKIYILRHKGSVSYVGITTQSIPNRLRYGLIAQGKNGYHGYKWKSIRETMALYIFIFKNNDEDRVEAIEAEIVYLIRNKTGRWPEYQTEIHFHNANKNEKNIAQYIYNEVR